MKETQTTNELFLEMKELWTEFELNHQDFSNKGVKKSAARARKAISAFKKLVTEYRKASISEITK